MLCIVSTTFYTVACDACLLERYGLRTASGYEGGRSGVNEGEPARVISGNCKAIAMPHRTVLESIVAAILLLVPVARLR